MKKVLLVLMTAIAVCSCGNKKMIVTVNRNGMQHADGEYIDLKFDGNHISYEQAKQHIPQNPY